MKEVSSLNAKPIVLKALLQHRHLQTHRAFCREYDRVVAVIDPTLRSGWPSKAQFYRWLSGDLVGLPHADHCRILEAMFPDWKVDRLFHAHDEGIEFIPEPATRQTQKAPRPVPPTGPVDQGVEQVVAFYPHRANTRNIFGWTFWLARKKISTFLRTLACFFPRKTRKR
jgi:hypothetical protein